MVTSLSTRIRWTLCGFRGHDSLRHFERNRISLKCVACGYESPGWELTARPPRQIAKGDAHRHRLVVPQRVRPRAA